MATTAMLRIQRLNSFRYINTKQYLSNKKVNSTVICSHSHGLFFSTTTDVVELPPYNKIKVPNFGSKGKVLEWHKVKFLPSFLLSSVYIYIYIYNDIINLLQMCIRL